MIAVFHNVSTAALIVCPANILFRFTGRFRVGTMVSDLVVPDSPDVVARSLQFLEPRFPAARMGATGNLVPLIVIGPSIAVGIVGNLDNTWLTAAVFCLPAGVECISEYPEIA